MLILKQKNIVTNKFTKYNWLLNFNFRYFEHLISIFNLHYSIKINFLGNSQHQYLMSCISFLKTSLAQLNPNTFIGIFLNILLNNYIFFELVFLVKNNQFKSIFSKSGEKVIFMYFSKAKFVVVIVRISFNNLTWIRLSLLLFIFVQ